MLKSEPVITKYSSILDYLNDYYLFCKSQNKHFSYDTWSAELGFKSPSYLRMVCKGERSMTVHFINSFSKYMEFQDIERKHMSLLVGYQQAKSEAQKKVFQDKILESISFEEIRYKINDYAQFLSSPLAIKILLLLSFDDVRGDTQNLKILLNTSVKDLNSQLKTLEKLGLIEFKNKLWSPKTPSRSFKLKDSKKEQAFTNFHINTLDEAKAMLKEDLYLRRFRSIYFSLADDEAEGFKEEVEDFLIKMKQKYGKNELNQRRLMKLNLQAYPVSQLWKK